MNDERDDRFADYYARRTSKVSKWVAICITFVALVFVFGAFVRAMAG